MRRRAFAAFGTNVFKIYFYTFDNISKKSHRAYEEYFSDPKILHNIIYLLPCSRKKKNNNNKKKNPLNSY